MPDTKYYPNFNDQAHDRPIISMAGRNLAGELIWLLVLAVVTLAAVLVR